jgi:hypothetical protein
MRWPADPGWQKPEMVGLVSQETPVNCLLTPRDWPLKDVAEKRGMRVMTLGDDQMVPLEKVKAGQTGIVAIKDGTWPSIGGPGQQGGGPTGNAWVESNGWRIRLAKAKAPEATIWVDAAPPEKRVLRPEHIGLAIADSAAYGGRWIIQWPDALAKSLGAMEPDGRRAGQVMAKALKFFDVHRSWAEYQPFGKVAVVSDFEGENEFLASEVLNLSPRRQLPYKVIAKSNPKPELKGTKAVLWVDLKAPAGEWQTALSGFVEQGGVLIVANSVEHITKGLASAGNFDGRYRLYSKGKGRIAVAKEPWSDPYELVVDTHLLLSRREDLVRLWNGTSSNLYCTEANGKALIHVLNYAVRSMGSPLSFWIARQYKTARWYDIVSEEPKVLELVHRNDGVEIALPDFIAYGAIELGEA